MPHGRSATRDPHRGPTQGTHTEGTHTGDPHRGPTQGTHTEGRAPQRTHHRRRGPHRGPTQNAHRQSIPPRDNLPTPGQRGHSPQRHTAAGTAATTTTDTGNTVPQRADPSSNQEPSRTATARMCVKESTVVYFLKHVSSHNKHQRYAPQRRHRYIGSGLTLLTAKMCVEGALCA